MSNEWIINKPIVLSSVPPDQLMRKKRLCNFLVNGCNGILGEQNNPSSISLIWSIAFIPLPLAGH